MNRYYYWEFAQTAGAVIIFSMIVVGNISILNRLKSCRRRRSNVNYFIVQLAIADLFVGFFSVTLDTFLRYQKAFTYGPLACLVSKYISVLFIYASTYLLVALSIDRWEAVVKPLAFTRNRGRGCYLVAGAWLLSLVCATPVTFKIKIKEVEGLPQCWIDFNLFEWRLYMVYLSCSLFLIPALVIAVCYTHIVYTIWSKGRQVERQEIERKLKSSKLVKLRAQVFPQLALSTKSSSSDSDDGSMRPADRVAKTVVLDLADDDDDDDDDDQSQESREYMSSSENERQAAATVMRETANIRHFDKSFEMQEDTSIEIPSCDRISLKGPPKKASLSRPGRQHGSGVIPRARIKTVKMTLAIVAAFILCWSPFYIINLCSVFHLMRNDTNFANAIKTLSQSLAHLNSAVNPIIFWIFSSKASDQSQRQLEAKRPTLWTYFKRILCCNLRSLSGRPLNSRAFESTGTTNVQITETRRLSIT